MTPAHLYAVTPGRYSVKYVNLQTGEVRVVDRTPGEPIAAIPPPGTRQPVKRIGGKLVRIHA
jgi:hypothetical protein